MRDHVVSHRKFHLQEKQVKVQRGKTTSQLTKSLEEKNIFIAGLVTLILKFTNVK